MTGLLVRFAVLWIIVFTDELAQDFPGTEFTTSLRNLNKYRAVILIDKARETILVMNELRRTVHNSLRNLNEYRAVIDIHNQRDDTSDERLKM